MIWLNATLPGPESYPGGTSREINIMKFRAFSSEGPKKK